MDLRNEIIQILTETRDSIVNNIESEGIKASGRTQRSLKVEDRGEKIVLFEDGSGAPFQTLQFGREGGKIPAGFAAIILQWMKDKGITAEAIPYKSAMGGKYTPIERGMMRRAYFISRKIAREGTLRHKQPNLNVYTQPIEQAIEKINKIITDSVISNIRRR